MRVLLLLTSASGRLANVPENAYCASLDDVKDCVINWWLDGEEPNSVRLDDVMGLQRLLPYLGDVCVEKTAYDAGAVRVLLGKAAGLGDSEFLPPEGWKDIGVWARVLGLPDSLEHLLEKVGHGEESAIRRFRRVVEKLESEPLAAGVWSEYWSDQRVNDRGVAVDIGLADEACAIAEKRRKNLLNELRRRTGLDNPNSGQQFMKWLNERGCKVNDVRAETLEALAAHEVGPIGDTVRMRIELGCTSPAKFGNIRKEACSDGRVRGMFCFYGAGRTGRWSSHGVQLHNLPRQELAGEALRDLRNGVLGGKECSLKQLKDLIRTVFVPAPGYSLIIADYSAIEARVLAWLADEKWKQEAFAAGEDLYCASASRIFGVPVEKGGVNAELRQYGKVAELALGYGGQVPAMRRMGGSKLEMSDQGLQEIVDKWRAENSSIVKFWERIENAAKQAILSSGREAVGKVKLACHSKRLYIELPSGRCLCYALPLVEGKGIIYSKWTGGSWVETSTRGAKLVENIVQAVARDLLANALLNLREARVVMHVHDEIVIETDGRLTTDDVIRTMCTLPEWGKGLVLTAEAGLVDFYRKA